MSPGRGGAAGAPGRPAAPRRRRGRRFAVLAGSVLIASLVTAVVANWSAVRIRWLLLRDFERVRSSDAPLPEYRHVATGIVMVLVPGGEFLQGSPPGASGAFPDERPQRRVHIDPFLVGKHEVTQAQWTRLMGSRFFLRRGDDLPAHGVSWIECREVCERAGLRLPTEAQWEYACRAGSTTPWSGATRLEAEDACFGRGATPGPDGVTGPSLEPVGTYPPNAFGLYDMHGNVEEWCRDAYATDAYRAGGPPDELVFDPLEERPSESRVVRGGSFASTAEACRAARRNSIPFSGQATTAGLRPVYELDGEPSGPGTRGTSPARTRGTTRGPP